MHAILRTTWGRLVLLTLVHFAVDFCGGLLIPLPEPTLIEHLAVGLPRVALLVGGCALLVNVIQPFSHWLLPRRGAPLLLAICPALAALSACIGLTHSYALAAVMLIISGASIGILHPETALAAHSVAGRHKGVAISVFMSGGYFGFSTGSLIAGLWVEKSDPALSGFWLLAGIPLLVTVLVLASGLHRLRGHVAEEETSTAGSTPLAPSLALAVCLAVNMCLVVRLVTILLVRRFPDQAAQAWGGSTVFATGVTGAIGAYLWGYLSDKIGRGWTVALVQFLAAPFLYGLLHAKSPEVAPLWGIGVGFTMGGVFPLSVLLAREARGLPQRLRMGLAIGGAWGLGEIVFILAGKYIGSRPDGAVQPVATVLNACWWVLGFAALLGLCIGMRERRAAKDSPLSMTSGLP